MEAHDLRDQARARIEKNRTAKTTLRLLNTEGKPLPAGTTVTATHTGHEFLFGCNLFAWHHLERDEWNRAYEEQFARLFNFATLPLFWGPCLAPGVVPYEGEEGTLNFEEIAAMARWCRERGITPKGHPLVFMREPRWIPRKSDEEIVRLYIERVGRDVKALTGLVDMFDCVNEATRGEEKAISGNAPGLLTLYRTLGNVDVVKRAFNLAREANPDATLILNDYLLTEEYYAFISRCLDAGAPIDAIGMQSHMFTWTWTPKQFVEKVTLFEKLGLPLHFTELSLPSGRHATYNNFDWKNPLTDAEDTESSPAGEQRQADLLETFYTILYSSSSVAALTYWDFSDRLSYMNTPGGLLRRDMNPKPAYVRLDELINTGWRTNTECTVNSDGEISLQGFHGSYRIAPRSHEERVSAEVALNAQTPARVQVSMGTNA